MFKQETHVGSHSRTIFHTDDLGSESGRHICKLLQRVSKKQRKARKLGPLDVVSPPDSVAPSNPQCGAPAAKHETDEPEAEPEWEDIGDQKHNKNDGLVVRLEADDIKARKKHAFTEEDRDLCKQMHRAHIMCLLARGVFMDTVADDEVLQAAVLSQIPGNIFDESLQEASGWSKSVVETLLGVFKGVFTLEKTRDMLEIPLNGTNETVVAEIIEKVGIQSCTVEECTVIFASLLRALGYPVRLVTCLEPMSFRPGELLKQMNQMAKEYQKRRKVVASKKKRSTPPQDDKEKDTNVKEENQRICDLELENDIALAIEATSWKDTNNNQAKEVKSPEGEKTGPTLVDLGNHWLEVFCGDAKNGQWIYCDPSNAWIDAPERVQTSQKKKNRLTYVVAFSGRGAKDVTRRYVSNFAPIMKNRDREWWDATMRLLRRKEQRGMRKVFSKAAGKEEQDFADLVEQRENKEFEEKVRAETSALPTTIEGFKNHREFVLKRHINKYQVLVPGCTAHGAHKGEPFYLRKNLRDIHTADRWKRLGREVKPSEIDLPCKLIKKKGAPPANVIDGDGDIEKNEQEMSRYYAEWQTGPWCPPAAKDGKVPKNDRGNVEVPPFAFQMPSGAVHVDLAHAAKVCKKLQIDFAPALTGFDIRSGRSVPRIEGVVVCQEFQELVENACSEYIKHQAELAKQKRLKLAGEAWEDFVKALITHLRVQKSYAGDVSLALLENASLKKDPTEIKGKAKKKTKGLKETTQITEADKDHTAVIEMEEI